MKPKVLRQYRFLEKVFPSLLHPIINLSYSLNVQDVLFSWLKFFGKVKEMGEIRIHYTDDSSDTCFFIERGKQATKT